MSSEKKIVIGDATFYHGDCLDITKDLEQIDLVVTSPPYDNLREYEKQKPFNFDDFKIISGHLFNCLKSGGVIVWIVGDATINGSETGTSFKQALYFKEIGFNLHDTMIYMKTGFNNPASKDRYHQIFEYMFIISKKRPRVYNLIKDRKNEHLKRGGGKQRQFDGSIRDRKGGQKLDKYGKRFNVWKVINPGIVGVFHPAVFPEQLALDHVISWSNENDLILDPFMGSGTTAIACYRTGRKFIGIEKEKKYFDIAVERYRNEIKQLRLPLEESPAKKAFKQREIDIY